MNYSAAECEVIREYLAEEFPEYSISEEKHEDSYCFRVSKQQDSYYLRVMFVAIHNEHAIDLRTQLDQYAVSSTMRSLGDFPVVVTESGCIFGSP
jgi:hypothetical protein